MTKVKQIVCEAVYNRWGKLLYYKNVDKLKIKPKYKVYTY